MVELRRGYPGDLSLGYLSNSECNYLDDKGKQEYGVSLCSERGTTQTLVKVPKYVLSDKG